MAPRANRRRNAQRVDPAGSGDAEVLPGDREDLPRGLEDLLGHRFTNPHLLELALTHRSFAFEASAAAGAHNAADPGQDNEQFEFLGDAVLGMIAAESLIRHFPHSREGELSRLRASVVSRKHLGKVGTRLDLGRWLRLGRTSIDSGGQHNAALLANTVEALIAAIYLDGGAEPARQFIEREVLSPALPQMQGSVAAGTTFSGAVGDFKSALQERLQASGLSTPEYSLLEESGPAHRRLFRIQVRVAGEPLAEAQASSKKEAQQEAARLATEVLEHRRNPGQPAPTRPDAVPDSNANVRSGRNHV